MALDSEASGVADSNTVGREVLSYCVVIVTRNRPEALALSLPLILEQTRQPGQVIIVDSSEDGSQNQEIVAAAREKYNLQVDYLPSAAGMTLQRNVGLTRVRHPIVLFPDDDSLLEPGVMAEVMSIYERDKEQLIGGVCSAESLMVPSVLKDRAVASYKMTRMDTFRKKIGRFRYHLERNFIQDPFLLLGRRLFRRLHHPTWLAEHNAVPVEWMTGFRMSYRTELIRRLGFDETLGKYALFEDTDASMRVLKTKLLVGARNVGIYHYKSPERRDNGYRLGAVQTLNRAYVLAKTGEMDRGLRWRYRIFTFYKILQYCCAIHNRFGRDRLAGSVKAQMSAEKLFRSSHDHIERDYLSLREQLRL